jgi:hypothetical protein
MYPNFLGQYFRNKGYAFILTTFQPICFTHLVTLLAKDPKEEKLANPTT